MNDEYFRTNEELWDQKTRVHAASNFYDLDRFRRTKNSLNPLEIEGLGDVSGKRLLHLQCHFGQDTLSWAHRGAEVCGVDFSSEAIQLARRLSAELEIPATFVQANVLNLDQELQGDFDIVFSSYGTVCWLPDLDRWAKVISHFLKPGGIFFLADFHPALYMFDHESKELRYSYFHRPEPYEETNSGSYADTSAPISHKEYFWSHSISETLSPLLREGLRLLEFREFPDSPYNCFPNMSLLPNGLFRFGDSAACVPHVYTLKMEKS